MKALKLSVLALGLVSTTAMANVVTSTANVVSNTTNSVVDGGKTLLKTFSNPAAVSAEVGTLGYGANIAWSVNPSTELQAGWAGGSFSTHADFDIEDVNYEADVDFSNPYLGVQLRPASNWLTIGAGVIVPDNTIELTAKPNGNVYRLTGTAKDATVKDFNVSDVGILKSEVTYKNSLAPYVTLGFRPNSNNRWGVFGELGAAYMGEMEAKVSATGTGEKAKEAVGRAQAEIDRKIKDDDKLLQWYPIVKLGATVRF